MAKSKGGKGGNTRYPQNKPSTTGNKSGGGRSNNTSKCKHILDTINATIKDRASSDQQYYCLGLTRMKGRPALHLF